MVNPCTSVCVKRLEEKFDAWRKHRYNIGRYVRMFRRQQFDIADSSLNIEHTSNFEGERSV